MLKLENVNYKYNKNLEDTSVNKINLQVNKNECILLCGRSGSGKTTLTKLINALIPNYYENGELSGIVTIDGLNTATAEIYEVSRVVSSVFQNPKTQFFNVNTTSEILFYLENRGYDREYMSQKLIETAQTFKIEHLLHRNIFDLSGGEKQIIAIAAAFASGTDIILLDEPSSNLDEEKTKLLGEMLSKLKALGKTIIISEHRFYYIKDIIDKVYYIDAGIIKKEFSKDSFFKIDNEYRKELGLRSVEFENLSYKKKNHSSNKKMLIIDTLDYSFDCSFTGSTRNLHIKNISFNFGNIIGIYGYNGVGKSTFIRLIMGLEKSKSKILIDGKLLSCKQRLKQSYLVMQDVNHQLFTDSIKTEVSLGTSNRYNDEDVDKVLKNLNIYDLKDKHPMSLSGGQKQRAAIASATLSDTKIICFDEPTSGMDYDNMMRISKLIKNTISDELIIFIISHDHEFLNNTADEIFNIEKYNKTFIN